MSISVRERILTTVVRWLAVLLILRVFATILSNYPDYFPPNFDSLFLQGHEATFTGKYRAAFYVHILSGPVVLISGRNGRRPASDCGGHDRNAGAISNLVDATKIHSR